MRASWLMLGKLGSSPGGATSDARIGTSKRACDAGNVAVNADSKSRLCFVSWVIKTFEFLTYTLERPSERRFCSNVAEGFSMDAIEID